MRYSVLMSVYHKEKPAYLAQSMESILAQTTPADDFVLVCDGPLGTALDAVVDRMRTKFGDVLQVVRLPQNQGLGNALNAGLTHCKNELVARMDSDDIARADRCERQLAVFARMPEVSIVSGTVEEFSDTPDQISARRVLPENQSDIVAFSKKRNPFNHPCVMYRKDAVAAAGGYIELFLLEDYYLWVRMLISGCQGYNIQQPLLWMRAGSDMYKRRGGWKYAKAQAALFYLMWRHHWISLPQFIGSVVIRCGSSLAPSGVRRFMFGRFLRK